MMPCVPTTAIVFARYMMLSVARRENEDDKTICELCFCLAG